MSEVYNINFGLSQIEIRLPASDKAHISVKVTETGKNVVHEYHSKRFGFEPSARKVTIEYVWVRYDMDGDLVVTVIDFWRIVCFM